MIFTQIYKKFAIITAFLLMAIFVVGLLPVPTNAQEAQTGTWIDASHIEYDGVIYIDTNPTDDNLNYKEGGRQEDCVNTIRDFSSDARFYDTSSTGQAKILLVETNGISGECDPVNGEDGEPIALANSENSRNLLAWVDSGRIQNVSNGDLYIRVNTTNQFAIEGGDACKSSYVETSGTTDAVIIYQAQVGNDCRESTSKDRVNTGIDNTLNRAALTAGEGTLIGNQEGAAEAFQDSCESRAGAFGWITCPFLKIMDSIVTFLDEKINELLYTPAELYEDEQIEAMWGSVRNIAYLLLIPALLVIVIGTALGFTILDPYTIKRSLPKLLVATIFIAISLPVLKLSIEIINAVGLGINGLITSVGNATGELSLAGLFDPDPVQSVAITGGVLGGTFLAASFWPIWLNIAIWIAIAVIITIFTVFFMLALRQLLILALVVFAPLAILAWIFPGTNKFWKLWWESFSKLLLLYPLIMAVLAVGRVFADVIQSSGIDGIVAILLKLVAYIGPFFFVPSAFKYGGTALASMGNAVNRGVAPLQKQVRQQRNKAAKGNYERIQAGTAFKGAVEGTNKDKRNKQLQRLALAGKAIKADGFRDLGAGIDAQVRKVKAHEEEEFFKDPDTGLYRGNDSVSGDGAGILNDDREGLVATYRRAYMKPGEKQAASVAKTEAAKVGVEGSEEYKAKYDEVYEQTRAIYLPEATRRAGVTADRVLAMNKRGDFRGALSESLTESGAFTDKDGNVDTKKRDVAVKQVVESQKKYGNTVLARGLALSAMEGGTYYEDNVDAWRAAGLTTHGDDNAEARMVVKGRKALQSAGRPEGLGSFGGTLGHMQTVSAKGADLEQARKDFADHLIANNPAATFANPALKDKYLDDIMGAFDRKIDKAEKIAAETGNQDELIRAVASTNSLITQIGTTKPVMAEKWAKRLMNKEIDVQETVYETVPKQVTKKVLSPTGLFNDKNEPIMTEKEIVEEVQEQVPVTKTAKRTIRAAAGEFKNTAAWQETVREYNTPEDFERQADRARNLSPAEQAAMAEIEAAQRIGGGQEIGGGTPFGGGGPFPPNPFSGS
jgi:hypothetical protein